MAPRVPVDAVQHEGDDVICLTNPLPQHLLILFMQLHSRGRGVVEGHGEKTEQRNHRRQAVKVMKKTQNAARKEDEQSKPGRNGS